MITEVEQESSIAKKQQLCAALIQLPVTELIQRLDSFQALREELRLIPFEGEDAVDTVIITQELLKRWSDELDQILAMEQAKDTCSRVRIWDNEGGSTT